MYQNFSIVVVLVRRQLDLEIVRLNLFSLIPPQVPLKISDVLFLLAGIVEHGRRG